MTPSNPEAGGNSRRRRRGLIVAAVVAGLVGAGAVGVELGRHGTARRTPGASAPPRSTGSAANASPSPTPTRPSLADRSQAVPTTTPPGVTWSLYASALVPRSATAGPSHVDGAVASGFAHTPLGALLAAANTAARYFVAPSGQWQRETAAMVLPGPGRDRYQVIRPTAGDAVPQQGYAQYAGFRFVAYDPSQAVVQVATKLAAQMQVSTLTVRWSAGDWRLQLQPDGAPTPTVQPITVLTGFVPWGL